MKHIDLFSGIGGFALAVDTVWPASQHVFCDFDPFCQQILKKHWPNSKIYEDIRTFTYTKDTKQQLAMEWQPQKENSVFGREDTILTGGFPCQPFSQAGRRKGTKDNRYLWPEMFRIISTFKPAWVIAENVRGLVTWNDGMVLEQVCTDLESQGYEVQPLIIPAVAVNAPHRRDRVWFIAHRKYNEKLGTKITGKNSSLQPESQTRKKLFINEFKRANSLRTEKVRRNNAADPESTGSKWGDRKNAKRTNNSEEWSEARSKNKIYNWDRNWFEVATELCRMDDGLPTELDGFKLTKAEHRKQRLKSLGNSIVPQVAIKIMEAIKNAIEN